MIDDRIVTLRIGREPSRSISAHEAVLTEQSLFFRTALSKKWREGGSREIELPHDDYDVVAAYVDWLYFGKIASKPIAPPELPIDDGEYDFLARLYSFGEKIQADLFCNTVVDAMTLKTDVLAADGTRTFPSHAAIAALYSGTPNDSPARRFLVDMYVEFGTEKWIPDEADLNHVEFLTDLTRALLVKSKKSISQTQSNYPRRHRWHKGNSGSEFLQPVRSMEKFGATM